MVTPPPEERARINAEASAWLARLQGPQRTAETEAALQDWLRADDAHQAAFERATEIWDLLPGAVVAGHVEPIERPSRRFAPMAMAASFLAMVGAGALTLYMGQAPVLSTHVGEQHSTTLDDGSRVALNTDSHLTVHFARAERRISLEQGEAMFDVAHDTSRPFIVSVGNEHIKALGTAFVVRKDGDQVRVTLLRGRVEVTRDGARPQLLAVLRPGDRLSAGASDAPRLDRPALDTVTAWRRGELLFDGTPLADAVAEVNRYDHVQVVVEDPRLRALPISGVFNTDDATEFAAAAAQLHGLKVRRQADTLLLTP
ncbi:FecR family protein [Sphingomonas sp. AP4-R1]|uniref:FecR family protein n=1 Tax=Sphingomonas sp. AP4-R1 TaxID=2735134 RepID=UPI001493CC03|nr:FecR family protein [Sphingomonas sp. AP4-R1]QJU60153.1 FecR family protein [Sphingomonas sp. AP4-R1]